MRNKASGTIDIWGIETNNLKDICVSLKKNAINLIIGPSGSGKSSLAYDTIAQIGQHEYMTMFADNISDPTYKVKGFCNMVAAVPLKQSNFNSNPRSTVGTYFGINRYIRFIYSALTGLSEDHFVLNKESNLCEYCHGVGIEKRLDENRLVDFNIPLRENPVRCWDVNKDFYRKIITEFCIDIGIDPNKSFRELTDSERNTFLNAESAKKYKIVYKTTNRNSSRTTRFYGIMNYRVKEPRPQSQKKRFAKQYISPMLGKTIGERFFSDMDCSHCNGKRYSSEIDKKSKINGVSIGEYMTTPFCKLIEYNNQFRRIKSDHSIDSAIDTINVFLKNAIGFNLGHLFFHRSIPTLSGGELQRLRMVQVFNTQLTDLLIVLDEPLCGLSEEEQKSLRDNILGLSKRHTLVIVDHGDTFVNYAKNVIALGEKSGKEGGRIIDSKSYLKRQKDCFNRNLDTNCVPNRCAPKIIQINLNSHIYKYTGVRMELLANCLNLITGASGVGKSTLLREYFSQRFESYSYINQKPIMGNKNSNVATLLDVANDIFSVYAKKFKKEKGFFSNNTGSDGCCPVCNGAGYVEYAGEIRLECKECSGTGFNPELRKRKYEIESRSVFDVWNMTLDESIDFFKEVDPKLSKKQSVATELLLGHLTIGQPTSTLSGGENVRIKLLRSRTSKAEVLGIDEPFKGLSNTEVKCVISYISSFRSERKTVAIVDHNKEASKYIPKHIELLERNGILVGEHVDNQRCS